MVGKDRDSEAMDTKQDWYAVLGLAPDCPQDSIRIRYLSLIQQLTTGPWKGGERPAIGTLHEAFRNLADPVMRAGYDRARAREEEEASAHHHPAAPPPAPQSRMCPFCEVPLPPQQGTGPEDCCSRCYAPLFPSQKHELLFDSRRLFDRLPFTMRVQFLRARVPQQQGRGVSVDLSLGGLRLITPVAIEVGERVMIDCEFCTAVAIVRRVVRGAADEAEVWEAGLQFVTLAVKRQRGGLISASA